MPQQIPSQIVYQGKYLSMAKLDHWEFATRNLLLPAVGIVALTAHDELLLVEQFRPPVGERVVELPAGLAGDQPGQEEESLLQAAQRELLEETGYEAKDWAELGRGFSSPGLSDESIVLFLAQDLQQVSAGGGDASEEILLHQVPRQEVLQWLQAQGLPVSLKVFAGLQLAESHLKI